MRLATLVLQHSLSCHVSGSDGDGDGDSWVSFATAVLSRLCAVRVLSPRGLVATIHAAITAATPPSERCLLRLAVVALCGGEEGDKLPPLLAARVAGADSLALLVSARLAACGEGTRRRALIAVLAETAS